jgi:hypothetical protein
VFGDRCYIWEPSPAGPIVTAFDIEIGMRLYSSPAVSGGFIQQLGLFVGPEGTVYAPRTQNNPVTDFLVAFDDTGTGLVERWRVPIGYVPFASHAVGHDGSVYAYRTVRHDSEVDLTVIRLDPRNGDLLDESPVILSDFPVQPRMAIDAARKLYLTNGGFPNGKVVCFDEELSVLLVSGDHQREPGRTGSRPPGNPGRLAASAPTCAPTAPAMRSPSTPSIPG